MVSTLLPCPLETALRRCGASTIAGSDNSTENMLAALRKRFRADILITYLNFRGAFYEC